MPLSFRSLPLFTNSVSSFLPGELYQSSVPALPSSRKPVIHLQTYAGLPEISQTLKYFSYGFPELHPYCLKEPLSHRNSDNGERIEAVGRLRDRMKERNGWTEGQTVKEEREQWVGRGGWQGAKSVQHALVVRMGGGRRMGWKTVKKWMMAAG